MLGIRIYPALPATFGLQVPNGGRNRMNTVADVHLEAEEIGLLSTLLYEEWEKCYEKMYWAASPEAKEHAAEHVAEARSLYEKVTGVALPSAPLGE